MSQGYSSFSLLICYIFGAYTGKYLFYKKEQVFKIFSKILIYSFGLFIFISISLITLAININMFPEINPKLKNLFSIRINSLPMIIQTFTIIIFIAQLNINKYISKVITFIGPLTFDVYLIHENPYIKNFRIKNYFIKYPDNLKLINVYLILLKEVFYIFSVSIFIAYIRNIIFRILHIRNICIKCELVIPNIIKYLI